MPAQAEQLVRVRETRTAYVEARENYIQAVKDADAADFSATEIAHAAHLTEGAVRQTLKRNP